MILLLFVCVCVCLFSSPKYDSCYSVLNRKFQYILFTEFSCLEFFLRNKNSIYSLFYKSVTISYSRNFHVIFLAFIFRMLFLNIKGAFSWNSSLGNVFPLTRDIKSTFCKYRHCYIVPNNIQKTNTSFLRSESDQILKVLGFYMLIEISDSSYVLVRLPFCGWRPI